MDEDELQGIVAAEISDAADFIDMEVGQDRAESTKYYGVILQSWALKTGEARSSPMMSGTPFKQFCQA